MGLGRSEAEAQDLMKKVLTAAGNLAVEEGGFSSAAMDIGVIVQPVFAGVYDLFADLQLISVKAANLAK